MWGVGETVLRALLSSLQFSQKDNVPTAGPKSPSTKLSLTVVCIMGIYTFDILRAVCLKS